MDFFSPEGVDQVMLMAENLRNCPHVPGEDADKDQYQDKLQVGGVHRGHADGGV